MFYLICLYEFWSVAAGKRCFPEPNLLEKLRNPKDGIVNRGERKQLIFLSERLSLAISIYLHRFKSAGNETELKSSKLFAFYQIAEKLIQYNQDRQTEGWKNHWGKFPIRNAVFCVNCCEEMRFGNFKEGASSTNFLPEIGPNWGWLLMGFNAPPAKANYRNYHLSSRF